MKHPLFIDQNGKVFNKLTRRLSGRAALAAAMIAPISRRLNYSALARKVFQIEQLPQGALPIYDRDIDIASITAVAPDITVGPSFKHNKLSIDNKGKVKKKSVLNLNPRRVIFPTFELYSNPTIKLSSNRNYKQRFFISDKGKITRGDHGIRSRRFNLIDRSIQKARQEIMAQEDAEIFKMLDEASVK